MNTLKLVFCLFFLPVVVSAQKVSYIPLPPWADTASGLILNAHSHYDPDGGCLYDSLGRLIRVEHGKCSLIEFVYEDGRWIPYYESWWVIKHKKTKHK